MTLYLYKAMTLYRFGMTLARRLSWRFACGGWALMRDEERRAIPTAIGSVT